MSQTPAAIRTRERRVILKQKLGDVEYKASHDGKGKA